MVQLPFLRQRKIISSFVKTHGSKISLFLFLTMVMLFSTVIMVKTFSYKDDTIILGIHVWSDFWANIPLIRSFSLGDNIPPEYPLFPGERIRYHFLFAMMVGMIERMGVRIDIAINFLSISGMMLYLFFVYVLTKKLTKSDVAGWLAGIFVLFNASFSWMYYLFGKLQLSSISQIIHNSQFGVFGPYDDYLLSAFWHLNIYTNQRHLGFSFGVLFFAVWLIAYSKNRRNVILGALLMGILGWLHKAMLLNGFVILGLLFLTQTHRRRQILAGIFFSIAAVLPAVLYLNGNGISKEAAITWRPGFLYDSTSWQEFPDLTNAWLKWMIYWFLNLGILPFTALFGWIWSIFSYNQLHTDEKTKEVFDKKNRLTSFLPRLVVKGANKVAKFFTPVWTDQTAWYLSGWAIFIAANLFSFSNDLATNHKLVNYTQIVWAISSAYFLIKLWKTKILWILTVPLFFMLTLGGIFDLFPTLNQGKYEWPDVQADERSVWIMEHTSPDAIFFNTSYSTNYITVTGRKIFWGWPYFTWSIGYPTEERQAEMDSHLRGITTKAEFCTFAQKNNLSYMVIDASDHQDDFVDLQVDLLTLRTMFDSHKIEFDESTIYLLTESCFNPMEQ